MIKLHVSSAIRSTFCWTSLLTIRYCLYWVESFCTCEVGDDSAVLGTWGVRGQLLALWVLEHGLCIFSRLETSMPMEDSWTCKRVIFFETVGFHFC